MVFVALMLKISICNVLTVKEISVKVDATFYEIKKDDTQTGCHLLPIGLYRDY